MAKISVVIPVYNVEKYLSQCLESVLAQTLNDIEIIVINNGASAKEQEIINSYAQNDDRIKVVNFEQNVGYGKALSTGIDVATSEYIGFVDSDDFIKPEMYENLYSLAQKNDCDIVRCNFYTYYKKDKKHETNGRFALVKCNTKLNPLENPKLLKMMPALWTGIYRREFLNQYNIRPLHTFGAGYQDTSFYFKVMSLAKFVYITDKAYHFYRCDHATQSVKNRKDYTNAISVEYDEITKFLSEYPEIKKAFNSQKLINQYRAYNWNMERILPELREGFIDIYSNTFKYFYQNGELTKEFFRKINKRDLLLLINNKEKFLEKFNKKEKRNTFRDFRRNLISVKINSARISISILGKQVIATEKR